MVPARINLRVYQGSTFNEVYRWESVTKTYSPINTVQKSAPCVVQVVGGSPTPPPGWRIRVTGVQGMKEINMANDEAYYIATGIASNNVTINSIDSSNYTTYTTGGILSWNTPVPLVGYTAKMQIRESVGAPLIVELTTANGGIVIDSTNYTITIAMTDTQTAAFSFPIALYSLELTDSLGSVSTFMTGSVTLVQEITT
jgi:hypothetical protein